MINCSLQSIYMAFVVESEYELNIPVYCVLSDMSSNVESICLYALYIYQHSWSHC